MAFAAMFVDEPRKGGLVVNAAYMAEREIVFMPIFRFLKAKSGLC
jgi:hypothetical protein